MSGPAPLPTGFTRTIASREMTIQRDTSTRRLCIEIGQPVQDVQTAGGVDWRCPVRWAEDGAARLHSAYGVDAMQALQQAMQWIVHQQVELAGQDGVSLRFLDWPFDPVGQVPVPPPGFRART